MLSSDVLYVPMVGLRQVSVINLGRKTFAAALKEQHRYVEQHLIAVREAAAAQTPVSAPHTLLLLEHDPVYTVGHRSQGYTPEDERRLRALGADFCVTNRGGLITFHGPGQLMAYPILNLKDLGMGMRHYICALQKTVISTCNQFGVKSQGTEHTGVWVQDRKICAMGIHGRRFVTSHGLALNVCPDLSWFDHIVPCGLEDKDVTSLSQELGRHMTLAEVTPQLLHAFAREFNVELIKQENSR